MRTKIAVISDMHYKPDIKQSARRGDFGDIFLLRTVHRLNRYIKPDVVLLLGDFVDDASLDNLQRIKKITDLLDAPSLIIPGNHDCPPEDFFKIFDSNPDFLDVNNCRFIPFYDLEMPWYNAERSKTDIERMKSLAADFSGNVISCQHVPLFDPGSNDCPYNYTNVDEIIDAMIASGVNMTIAGHYHYGFVEENQRFGKAVAVPALCESPFQYFVLTINQDGDLHTEKEALALPEDLHLSDVHLHSHYAYCNENMDFQKCVDLGKMFNLEKLSFSEHSSHLYFSYEDYAAKKPFLENINCMKPDGCRLENFQQELQPLLSDHALSGIEVDCDFYGRPIVLPDHLEKSSFVLGAMHAMPEHALASPEEATQCFLTMLESFLEFPMHALAHPFRAFRRAGFPVPEELFPVVVQLLKKHNIAAELNFHTNEPSERFFQLCLEEGVKIVFGSDSHNLYEVGEFYPHLKFIERIGYTAELGNVLLPC